MACIVMFIDREVQLSALGFTWQPGLAYCANGLKFYQFDLSVIFMCSPDRRLSIHFSGQFPAERQINDFETGQQCSIMNKIYAEKRYQLADIEYVFHFGIVF